MLTSFISLLIFLPYNNSFVRLPIIFDCLSKLPSSSSLASQRLASRVLGCSYIRVTSSTSLHVLLHQSEQPQESSRLFRSEWRISRIFTFSYTSEISFTNRCIYMKVTKLTSLRVSLYQIDQLHGFARFLISEWPLLRVSSFSYIRVTSFTNLHVILRQSVQLHETSYHLTSELSDSRFFMLSYIRVINFTNLQVILHQSDQTHEYLRSLTSEWPDSRIFWLVILPRIFLTAVLNGLENIVKLNRAQYT